MDENAFIRTLRERRRALDLTQAELAARIGCATITLKQIEQGRLRPSRPLAERMLEILDIPHHERVLLVHLARRASVADARRNPYKGLHAFGEADAEDFFGREALVTQLLARLTPAPARAAGPRFLCVVGPSGSGKSSVVRAGLIAALRRNEIADGRWRVAEMTPGANPLTALSHTRRRLRRGLRRLLIVDQLEEAFSLCADAAERTAFLRQIAELATTPDGPWVISTLRADFYDRPLQDHAFGSLLRNHTEVVLPLAPDELARAITSPAARAGLAVEPALVAAIVADAEQRPGALPLLQYALTELFERRAEDRLTLAGYRGIGGLSGVISRRADELFAALDDAGRETARQIFLRMIQPGEAGEVTRRRAALAELPISAGGSSPLIIELFANHRLLTLDRSGAPAVPTVELAHESLVDAWERLRGWLEEHRDELRTHRRLSQAAADWRAAACETSFLARGAQLGQFVGLAAVALNDDERAFLTASVAERDRQAAEERAREEALRESLALSDAQRLAAESLKRLREGGNAELIALLALRSLALRYTPQGDEALCGALELDHPTRRLAGHTAFVYSVAYTPDAAAIVSGSGDGTVRRWDAASGAELWSVRHSVNAEFVAVLSNGRHIAAGGMTDTPLALYDASGACVGTLPNHPGGLTALLAAPDGRTLVSAGHDGAVRVWDVGQQAARWSLDGQAYGIASITIAPDGLVLLGGHDGRVRAWQPGGADEPRVILDADTDVMSIAVTPSGRVVITGGGDGSIRLWDWDSGREIQRCDGHTAGVRRVAAFADGRYLASASEDATVRVWDAATGEELRRLSHQSLVFDLAITPDGAHLATASNDGCIYQWDLRGRAGPPPMVHGAGLCAAFPSADGRQVATAGQRRTVHIWSAETGALLRALPHESAVQHTDWLPRSHRIVTACYDGSITVWDRASGQPIQQVRGPACPIRTLVVVPDGQRVVAGHTTGDLWMWDLASGQAVWRQRMPQEMYGAAITPDGRTLLVGSDSDVVRRLDARDGVEQATFQSQAGVWGLACSPDGRFVLVGAFDGAAYLYEIATGAVVQRFAGQPGVIFTVAFSDDGRLVLTGGTDQTARLWETATGREIRRFAGHSGFVWSVAFMPGGARVLTAGGEGRARLWEIDLDAAMRELRGRLLRDVTEDERAQFGLDRESLLR